MALASCSPLASIAGIDFLTFFTRKGTEDVSVEHIEVYKKKERTVETSSLLAMDISLSKADAPLANDALRGTGKKLRFDEGIAVRLGDFFQRPGTADKDRLAIPQHQGPDEVCLRKLQHPINGRSVGAVGAELLDRLAKQPMSL